MMSDMRKLLKIKVGIGLCTKTRKQQFAQLL